MRSSGILDIWKSLVRFISLLTWSICAAPAWSLAQRNSCCDFTGRYFILSTVAPFAVPRFYVEVGRNDRRIRVTTSSTFTFPDRACHIYDISARIMLVRFILSSMPWPPSTPIIALGDDSAFTNQSYVDFPDNQYEALKSERSGATYTNLARCCASWVSTR